LFPLIPLPIIEAIIKAACEVFSAVMEFPLIPLPIIEAIREEILGRQNRRRRFPLIPLPIIEAIFKIADALFSHTAYGFH